MAGSDIDHYGPRGADGWFTVNQSFTRKRDGVTRCQLTASCHVDDLATILAADFVPGVSQHPDVSYLVLDEVTDTTQEGDEILIEATYAGYDGEAEDGLIDDPFEEEPDPEDPQKIPEPVYVLDRQASSESVESLQRFIENLDEDEWEVVDQYKRGQITAAAAKEALEGNSHALVLIKLLAQGTDSRLAPRTVWRETLFRKGRINSVSGMLAVQSPRGNPPSYANCEWLFVGCTQTDEADLVQVNSEWWLSDPGGWLGELYTGGSAVLA